MKFNDSKVLSDRKPHQAINLAKAFFLCHTSSTLIFPSCQYVSIRSKPCYGFSLGITKERSLIGAFSFYTKTKEISDVSCDGCGLKVVAKKRVLLEEGAPFLIIQLNRFFSPEDRIKGCITFPLSLDLAPYYSSSKGMHYELYGFIVHAGEYASSWHYYNVIFESSSWYKLNNEDFDPVDEQEVLKQEAYTLFYRRHTIDMNAMPSYSDTSLGENSEEERLIPLGMIHHP
ncbi:UCH domain-containing protein [Cephalotus follicularis]|uniref:ubiquitinyl hydrolase 1 n=1 Tax=Cephalotus follicularis TaxID=3775 RepID=A0A1Q3BT43_CEPFO|nr:UCH domain-containing protein [Cephalotus follicularis]